MMYRISIAKVQEKVSQQVAVLSVRWMEPAPEYGEELYQQDASQQIKGFPGKWKFFEKFNLMGCGLGKIYHAVIMRNPPLQTGNAQKVRKI